VSIRTVIVDDEPLARRALLRFLDDHPDITVTAECGDGKSAKAILEQQPDLVFLDVQMPEGDGFEVIDRVGLDRMPVTIFVTAYGHYALRAFDTDAVDYLFKPFARVRFERALTRARQRLPGRSDRVALDRLLRGCRGSVTGSTGLYRSAAY
jgi:two-component system, LytTR family, response regulator